MVFVTSLLFTAITISCTLSLLADLETGCHHQRNLGRLCLHLHGKCTQLSKYWSHPCQLEPHSLDLPRQTCHTLLACVLSQTNSLLCTFITLALMWQEILEAAQLRGHKKNFWKDSNHSGKISVKKKLKDMIKEWRQGSWSILSVNWCTFKEPNQANQNVHNFENCLASVPHPLMKLDFGNAILPGISSFQLNSLQAVMNAAAHLVF